MPKQEGNSNNKKYRCWINKKDKILSFTRIDGYEIREFNTHAEFKEYYYNKSYWGYKVR